MYQYKLIIFYFSFIFSILSAHEFTISSYNCGGLSDHYDYLRAAAMQKLMQERYTAEPESMYLNEKIQKLALKILFSKDSEEVSLAQQEWDLKKYQQVIERLTASPSNPNSPNTKWNKKVDQTITSYKIRPVNIYNKEVTQMLKDHLRDLSRNKDANMSQLEKVRATMAKRIFAHYLKHDIICLQEADYLDQSMFPKHYEVILAETSHSQNGVAWNKNRFELIESIGDIMGRAFAVHLRDKKSGKTVLVASGHITGCNPYYITNDPKTGTIDSAKGDAELKAIVELFSTYDSDLKLIGMDSNVTALHPRLNILKDAGFQIDYENHLEQTCTNPYQVLNTRIDWIALKSDSQEDASVTNIPVLNVGLNSIQTNISDHKPIAAKITF